MRTIKFRGKSVDKGEWVYGFLIGSLDPHSVETKYRSWFIHNGVNISPATEVVPDTIGQFIGVHDINGKEIYEGDVLKSWSYPITWNNNLSYDSGGGEHPGFYFGEMELSDEYYDISHPIGISKEDVVIGNIHDNPELKR